MDASYVQTSFAGGEWSQFVQGRYDRPDYRTALNVCLNGLPVETGTWVRRPGFRFAQTTRSGLPGRVIKFDFQQNAPYTMEITDLHLRFFSGAALVTTNDSAGVTLVSTANPAVVELGSAVTWSTGDQAFFSNLAAKAPLVQNRVFTLTKIDTNHFSLVDAITGLNVDGSTLAWDVTQPALLNRVLDIPVPYVSGNWASLRSVQTEKTAFLLTGTVQPYAVTVSTQPMASAFATFAVNAAVFNDGPYLDAFTNGVQANASATKGIVTITLSFPTWSATTAYAKDVFITQAGNNYKSLADQNINKQPSTNPTWWQLVSAGAAIGPNGFQGSDIGRLVRLYSEPPEWLVATTYNNGDVASYNPSGLPGQSTSWQSLTGANTGFPPGKDLTHWQLIPQGAAIWTWGKITALSNIIAGNITGSLNFGDMTSNGGLAAAFDGVLFKVLSLSALGSVTGGATAAGTTVQYTSYVGKNYASTPHQRIAQATVYPSSDFGFGKGVYVGSLVGDLGSLAINFVLNLRANQNPPGSSSDGTLLGTTGSQLNTLSPITIISNDQTTQWNYVWIEIQTFAQMPVQASSYSLTNIVSQELLFNPSGAGTSAGITMEILGPALLYSTPIRIWRLGVYSDAAGWPTCGTYHEGRLWLSGAVPNRIDASVSNGIVGGTVNFAPTDQYGNVSAASAISYVFNAPDANPIFWMVPDLQGIICGSKAGEWLVQAPTNGGLTPTNIAARRVTGIGCANIEPKRTEHTTIFVQKFGRKIMEYFADVYSGKFSAPNLSLTAKHLTSGGIQELAYQQELAPVIWARVDGGVLRGCTYKRESLVSSQGPTLAGWHRHTLGSGRTVASMAVGPSVGGTLDALTIVTNDAVTNVRHVEVMTDLIEEGATLSQASYLDDAVVPSSTTSSTATPLPYGGLTLNGLWHLNGKTVTAWLGGLDCGDYAVANGSITVPYGDGISGGTANGLFTSDFVATFAGAMPMVVGFTYTSRGQIVRPNSPQESGARNGPAFGKKRRTMQYAAQLEGTQGVSFGTDFTKLYPANFQQANGTSYLVNQQFSGIFWTTLADDYSFDSMIGWQVTRPYICNIAALGGYLHTQDR